MIDRLYIKNVALIEEAEIEFSRGLNILSGETGAGKSMVIDAINFLLGQRPGKDFLRTGASEAIVEGLLTLNAFESGKDIKIFLEDLGVVISEDDTLVISRTYNSQNKSFIRINGRSATVGMLKEISSFLVDVHGQHEHQSLLKPTKHIVLLDKFCEGIEELKDKLNVLIKKRNEVEKNIIKLTGTGEGLGAKLRFLQFQIDEITAAGLKPGEEEELSNRRRLLSGAEKLMENCQAVIELLNGGNYDGDNGVDKINSALKIFYDIVQTDPSQQDLLGVLEGIAANLDDFTRDIRRYSDSLEHDPSQLQEVVDRIELIYNLKRKYGGSVEEIIQNCQSMQEEYELILNSESLLENYNNEMELLQKKILKLCADMSKLRTKHGKLIQHQVETNLRDLGMKDAKFEISIVPKANFSYSGMDDVEFLISPNVGESVKPLAKIASGGEMSRVMLALKSVLADADTIDTFIFDEIDQGVSGRTAQKVAEKLTFIAKSRQILCITHLPQIAAMADHHLLIEKKTHKNKTNTSIVKLSDALIIEELARLIGGAEITNATKQAAKEIKEMADSLKA